jgi:hypothetical protein
LQNRVEAQAFYDYRNGFVFGPNNTIVAGLPERLAILQVSDRGVELQHELLSSRFERDPIKVWFGLNSEQMYTQAKGSSDLIQIDTTTGNILTLSTRDIIRYRDFDDYGEIKFGNYARIIGQSNDLIGNPFLRLLLGDNYIEQYDHNPLTVTLIDILEPQTPSSAARIFLLYVYDDASATGHFIFSNTNAISEFAVSPNGNNLMIKRANSDRIEIYDMDSGNLEEMHHPMQTDRSNVMLDYNGDGSVIIIDFQRLDSVSGEVLFQDLDYLFEFDTPYFTEDNNHIVTTKGDIWRVWDLSTGEIVHEQHLDTRGQVIKISDDAHRIMSNLNEDGRQGIEVLEVGRNERRIVFFDNIIDRSISSVISSPDWENYFVIYSSNQYGPYGPGNVVAMYNMDEGKRWLIAGDDLPPTENRQYGWIDNDTVYVQGTNSDSWGQPTRIYDLEYDANGLPSCLVTAFPDDYTHWLGLWEYLVNTKRSDTLGYLAMRLCDVVPGTTEDIENVFHPSPTPTRAPITATPSSIAGVPLCLTSRFSSQARDYAEDWWAITEDMSEKQIDELEILLCENLTGSGPSGAYYSENPEYDRQVMTIDIITGRRDVGSYLPMSEHNQVGYSLELLRAAFWEAGLEMPSDAKLSPNGRLVAGGTSRRTLIVYHLPTTYDEMVVEATQTAEIYEEEEVLRISLYPTATQAFSQLGTPRPTLTPTVTPTAPPPAQQIIPQSDYEMIQEFCPSDELYTVDSLPPDYVASGKMLVLTSDPIGYYETWVLQPETGQLLMDETLLNCERNNCDFSFDRSWIVWRGDDIILSRPDGSDARILLSEEDMDNGYSIGNPQWFGLHTLQYTFEDYVPDSRNNPETFIQRIDPNQETIPTPYQRDWRPPIEINDLDITIIGYQPGTENRYVVVRTQFNTGRTIGYKYYIYDREAEEALYFARLSNYPTTEMTFYWHPLGDTLYYHYPGTADDMWYAFDTATRQHYLFGEFHSGEWSPDGRFLITEFSLFFDEEEERREAGLPIYRLSIWDRESGLTRRYCVPHFDIERLPSRNFVWSPDNRYLVFRATLPQDQGFESAPVRTLIMDTYTGSVTEIQKDVRSIIAWMGD